MSPFYYFSPLFLQTLIWPGTRFCLWLFGGLKVRGLENLASLDPKGARENGIIFAVNHTSDLDPILIPAALPFLSKFMPIFYTSRERSFYDQVGPIQRFFYGGLFFKLWGSHAVKVGLKDYEKSLATHVTLLESGKSVLIFPEGGINRAGGTNPAKGGVAYLALHCQSPVIPVAVSGVFRMSLKDFFLRRRNITVQFLPTIIPEKISLEHTLTGGVDYALAAQTIMNDIHKVVQNAAEKETAKNPAKAPVTAPLSTATTDSDASRLAANK